MSLAAITALVDDKLRSVSLGAAANTAARDRAITQALVQYSEDEPQDLVAAATANGYFIDVPAEWVPVRSRLQAVEYPLDQLPMAMLEASELHQVSGWRIVLAEPVTNLAVRVHFTAPHAADGSTVPDHHINAVACLAASELCRQLATQLGHDRDASIGAMAQQQGSQSGDMARRAKEWLAVYRVALGLPDPDKAGAGTSGKPAGAVVSWGARRVRGRFYSYQD
jgi:hypothetical protein